jgi:hypothetical protein
MKILSKISSLSDIASADPELAMSDTAQIRNQRYVIQSSQKYSAD